MMIIKWKSKITGFEGQGEPVSDEVATSWCNEMNAKYPMLEHWTEVVE